MSWYGGKRKFTNPTLKDASKTANEEDDLQFSGLVPDGRDLLLVQCPLFDLGQSPFRDLLRPKDLLLSCKARSADQSSDIDNTVKVVVPMEIFDPFDDVLLGYPT